MSIRNSGGLDFSSLPSFVTARPAMILIAAKFPTKTAVDAEGYLFTAYHEPSGGEDGFTDLHMGAGYMQARDRGANSSAPDGAQEFAVDFDFGEYGGYNYGWVWVGLDLASKTKRTVRVQDRKTDNTAVFNNLPTFSKVALGENLHSSTLMAQAHFLSTSLTDAQWASLVAGNLNVAGLTGYLDGFDFKNNLTSKKGTMTLTARTTPTYVNDDPAFYSGGTAPAFTLYGSGLV